MATNVKVITAYCDLGLTKRPSKEFTELGWQLEDACGSDVHVYGYAAEECWTWDLYKGYPAANARAPDRFVNSAEHERSNLIQHAPVQWLEQAALDFPNVDVFVWMGYSILKQGGHTGNLIKPHHVTEFVGKLKSWVPDGLPFPGMLPRTLPIDPFGDNWRFCGSTLIIPREYIFRVGRAYRTALGSFVSMHGAVPLDLAIWPMVEFSSGLHWRWYRADYDSTQLTNFPF